MRFTSSRWLSVLLAYVFALGSGVSLAQEPSAPSAQQPSRRSYVPLRDLQTLVERDQRGVLMPRAEFEALLKRAEDNGELPPNPPASQVLGTCAYAARIVGDQLLIQVEADLEQLAPQWKIWKFPLKRVSVEKALVDDQPAIIGRTNDHALTVVTEGKGRHRLLLELSTELVTVGSDRAAIFSLLPGATGEFSLEIPAGKRLIVDNAELERPAPTEEAAMYRVAVGGKPQLTIRITDRESDQRSDVLTLATSGYGLVVAPGEVTWHVLTSLQVYGRPVDQLSLSVPGYLEIADVESTGLEGWELQDDPTNPDRTRISLTYGQAFEGARQIAVRGVMSVPAGTAWSVPPLVIENVNSHVGQVVVQHPVGVRMQVIESDGVRRATEGQQPVSDMPDDMATNGLVQKLRFDIWREGFALRLTTAPKERELHAAIASLFDISSTEVGLQAAFTLTTRHAPLFDVDFELPAEWVVISATGEDGSELTWRMIPQQAGTNRVRIPLAAPLADGATTSVKLQLRRDVEGWPVEETPLVLALPELVIPQAAVVETALVVRGDSDLELTPQDINGLDVVPLKAEWERLRFQSQDTRYGGNLKVSRRRAQTAVETIGFYRLDRQSLSASLFSTITIQGGGLRQILVSLPESVPESQRFEAVGGTLVEQSARGVVNGRRLWQLQFAERILGTLLLTSRITVPRGDAEVQDCPLLEVANIDRAHGAIVVESGPDQRLTLVARDAANLPLGDIDPLDIPPTNYMPVERIVAVYRTIGDGNSLKLSEERYEKAAVPTAVCTGLNLLTIVSRSGELQQRAEFVLRLAGVQQLQVELPDTTELWAATLDDQPVEIRRRDGQLLIAVPGGTTSDTSAITLHLYYRSETTALQGSGTLLETPPALSVMAGQGTPQPVDVLEQTWKLIHPSDTLVVDNSTALEPTTQLDQPGWFLGAGHLVRVPSLSDSLWGLMLLGGIVVGVATVSVLLQEGAIARRLIGLSLVIVIGMVGLSLMLPAVQQSREAALRTQARNLQKQAELAAMDAETAEYIVKENFAKAQFESGATEDAKALTTPANRPMPAAVQFDALPAAPPVAEPAAAAADPFAPVAGDAPQRDRDGDDGVDLRANLQDALPALSLGVRQTQGLLSLPLVLDQPDDTVEKSFRYVGGGGLGSGIPLQIDYVNRQGGTTFRTFLGVVGLLLGWWFRKASALVKCMLVLLGLTVGVGLSPAAPVTWQTTLDGVLFAVIGMCVAWLLWSSGRFLVNCRNCCTGWWQRVATSVLILGLTVVTSAQAAEPAPPQQPSATQKTVAPPVVPPPVQPPFPPSQIMVYDDAKAPLAADRVFLPFDKFTELYRRAYPEKLAPSLAPTTAKIVDSLYSAQLLPNDNDSTQAVRVTARYTILSYVDGQQPVEIPIRGAILRAAQINGKPAALVTSESPWKVLIPAPGLHVVDLELLVPAQGNLTAGSVSFQLTATPAARLAFQLPVATHAARVNGSTSVYRRVTRDDETHIELPADAGGDMQISWQPEQARGGAAVVHVESATAVSIADAGISASVGFNYRIRQGVLRDLAFLLPERFQLQGVIGPDVGGWEIVGEGAQRKLRVFLRRNVNDATQLTLDGFLGQRVDQELAFRVPELIPQDVTTEAGTVSVYATDAFSVRAEKLETLNQVDAAKFEPAVPVTRVVANAQLAYRFSRRPWSLDIRTSRLVSQLEAQVHQGVLLTARKQLVTARVECRLARVPRSSLALRVPENWLVLDVQSPELIDWYATAGTAGQEIILEYASPQVGEVSLVLTATQARDPDAPSVTVETLQVLGADKQSSQLAVWLDAGDTAQVADVGNWQSLDATTIHPLLRALRPSAAQLAFSNSTAAPTPVALQLKRLTPQLTADSLTVVTVTDVAVVYGCVFEWNISAAATDRLTLETPTWLAARLQFHAPEIREALREPVDDQVTRWNISLRGPVMGSFKVAATASLPPATDRVASPALRFVTMAAGAVTPLETQRHYVLMINTSLSQLSLLDPDRVEPVQRDDVGMVIRDELLNQATEFVRLKPGEAAPAWSLERYIQAPGIPAAVNLADLMTIVARDGTYREVATFTVKNRNRQFLAVRMPEGARLLSVLVGQQPSRAVSTLIKDRAAYLIALPKTSAVDLSFPVQVITAGQLKSALPARSAMLATEIDLPTVEVVRLDESPEFGVPVARTQWTVYFPDDLDATPVRDPQRFNLNRADESVTADSMISVLISDADEVLSALSSVNNYSGKKRAYSNLKQLDMALDSYGNGPASGEQQRHSWRLKESITKLERELDRGVNSNGNTIVDYALDDLALTENEAIRGRVQGGDANVQLGRAITNNGILIKDNGNATDGISLDFGSNTTFNFDASTLPQFQVQVQSGPATAKSLAKQASPAPQANSLQARQKYQGFNERQLEELNADRLQRRGTVVTDEAAGEKKFMGGGVDDQRLGEKLNQMPNRSAGSDRTRKSPRSAPEPQNSGQQNSGQSTSQTWSYSNGGDTSGSQGETREFIGGGMGGGFGGGGGVDGEAGEVLFGVVPNEGIQLGLVLEGWTQPGGLSLPFELPTAGSKLVFTKAGGDARLALSVRTEQGVQRGLGYVWAIVWIAISLFVLVSVRGVAGRSALLAWSPLGVAVASAAGVLLLARPFNILCLVIFFIAVVVIAWKTSRANAHVA